MEEEKIIQSPDVLRENRLPEGQRQSGKWPVLHYGDVPSSDTSLWTFKIWGLVDRERKLNYEEFTALPRIKVHSDIHCVTGWSKLDNIWEGPGARTIFELTSVSPKAGFVIVHATEGFTTNIPLEDFLQPDVVFALKHDGKDIAPEHGYPIRLVVPRLYFWKSAKWVTGIEFTEEDRPGFWETRGYHNHGDPWKGERYS